MKWAAALVLVVLGATLALGKVETALGHAALLSSDPAANSFLQRPPGQISLSFAEPIDTRSSTITLLDANGQPVAIPAASVGGASMTVALPQLKPGIYNVIWANVSRVDGHAIRGSFPFTVLNPDGSLPDQSNAVGGLSNDSDPPPLADGVAVRALSLLGLAMVVAGAVVMLLLDSPDRPFRKGLVLTVYAGTLVLLAATALNFATIHDAYDSVAIRNLIFNTPAGGYWLTRIGLVMLIAVANTFAFDAPRRTAAALIGCVGVYLWAYTATSHAAAGAGSSWAKGLDILHGVSALVWIGAVAGIAIAARLLRKDAAWQTFVPRFSLLASVCVFMLLGTGFLGAFVEIDKVSKLWETNYGVILLIKLGLMLPLLLVAGYNAKYGKSLLTRGTQQAQRRFLLFASGELALGLAVFVFAAMLTQTTVAKSIVIAPDRKPFDETTNVSDLQIKLAINPNQTGLNTYRVELHDAAGGLVAAQRVRLTFRYQEDQTIGASTLILSSTETGVYVGQGPFMTIEGRWRVETEVRRADTDDIVGFFDVRPAGTAVLAGLSGTAWSNPAPGLNWNQFGGFVFLIAGLGFALARTPVRRLGREAGWAASGMTMAGFSFGVLLLFGVHSHVPTTGLPANPIYPDADSISKGRTLYAANCSACHGQSGVPPKGLDLNPYPLDLTVHVPLHADGQLYLFIRDGIAGSAMPAWGKADPPLTDEQIWHLVNFLRTLQPVDR
ncbi:MAG: copper resistance protein CopC [Dehalococcoidia bacterium]